MKNPLFAHENEYRVAIVRLGSDASHQRFFRELHGAFIPYISKEITLQDVAEIGISPTHRSNFVGKSVQELLESKGINATIFNSEIPLRY